MKYNLTVWTLSWDTREGTNCRVFGDESEMIQYFRTIIESTIQGVEDGEAIEIRSYLAVGEIGLAYDIWQENYKPELDTYNWDSQVINVEVSDVNFRRIA